jgi:hypothetical protein
MSEKRRDAKQKAHRQNDDGLVSKNSREFRSPVELFLASIADWKPDTAKLVMAA